MKKLLAVLATAALVMVASHINAADSYSPDSAQKGIAVSVDPTSHVQVYPAPYKLLQGYSGDATNGLSATGTNFIASPVATYQYINASNDVNFVYATNKTAGSGWATTVAIKANLADRALAVPATWNWLTNSAQSITGTNVFAVGKLSTVGSNTFALLNITSIGTNIFIKADVFRP